MINDIYSKDEYFRRELRVEQDDIRHQKKEFAELLNDLERQRNPNDLSCRRCFSLISQIDIRQISRILDNQQYVKYEYDQCLLPLQSILIVLCLFNNLSIQFIFQQALKLFLLSNLFLLICLGVYAEFFVEDRPSVFYTLIIAVFIHLFTMFLLFHVLKTFVIIRHYQHMKKTLINIQWDESILTCVDRVQRFAQQMIVSLDRCFLSMKINLLPLLNAFLTFESIRSILFF